MSVLIANGTIISVMKLSGLVRLTCLGDTDQLGSTTQYLQVISAASVGRATRNFCLRAKACFIVFAIRIKRGTTAVPLRYIGTLKKITFENIGHSCHVWTVAFWLHYVANA